MNWSHSGGMLSAVGFVWVVAAILVVTNASPEVWLACGIAGGSRAIAKALQPDRRQRPVIRGFKSFRYRRQTLTEFRARTAGTVPPEREI